MLDAEGARKLVAARGLPLAGLRAGREALIADGGRG